MKNHLNILFIAILQLLTLTRMTQKLDINLYNFLLCNVTNMMKLQRKVVKQIQLSSYSR